LSWKCDAWSFQSAWFLTTQHWGYCRPLVNFLRVAAVEVAGSCARVPQSPFHLPAYTEVSSRLSSRLQAHVSLWLWNRHLRFLVPCHRLLPSSPCLINVTLLSISGPKP
jgi:hypothetical protein